MCELGAPSGCRSKTTSTKYRPPAFMHTGASRTAALEGEGHGAGGQVGVYTHTPDPRPPTPGHVTFSLTWSLQEGAELYFLAGHWCTCPRPGTPG